MLSYFSSPAGQKFLEDLERDARAKRIAKAGAQKQASRNEGADGAVHSISLEDGREARGRRLSSGGSTPSANGVGGGGGGGGDRNKEHEVCPGSDYENRDHVQPASDRHVASAVWTGASDSQSAIGHHIRPAEPACSLSGRAREASRWGSANGDVFEGE